MERNLRWGGKYSGVGLQKKLDVKWTKIGLGWQLFWG